MKKEFSIERIGMEMMRVYEGINKPSSMEERCSLCESKEIRLLGSSKEFDFIKCEKCGLHFVSPLPSEKELSQFYDNFIAGALVQAEIQEYSALAEESLRHQLFVIHSHGADFEGGKRYLEVGFGGGHYLAAAERLGYEVHGVEIDKGSCEKAIKPGRNIHNCQLSDAPFENNYFDIAKAMHVLEHSNDPMRLVLNIFKVLKPGGFLILDVPNQSSLMAKFKILLYKLRLRSHDYGYLQPPIHLYAFHPAVLEKFMKRAGFEVMKMVYASPLDQLYFPTTRNYYGSIRGWITKALYRILGRGSYITIYARKPDG